MLSGTGLKIKVVEALSYGIPVVCNQRGVDGLLNKINNGCLSTESENEFADSILKLLSNNSFYVQNKKNAENFFKATLSETIVYKKLDSIFNI
jgi:glycosyltransferase involved in cell wall biosynthesis